MPGKTGSDGFEPLFGGDQPGEAGTPGAVTRIIAGAGIGVAPAGGTGNVTVTASFGPAPPPIAQGNIAAAGVATTAARSDQVNAQFLIADWPFTTVRTFLYDPVNGVDTNPGFSDVVGPYNPVTQAKKTLAGLQSVFPRSFAARNFRLLIASGAYANDLDVLLGGAPGIAATSVVRGTSTNATAGCTAFDDTAADRAFAGAVPATSTNAAGYNPTAGATTTLIPCQLNGGGAPAFGAEPASPLMWRIRFSVTTATVALRNVSRTVLGVPTNASLTTEAFPAVPAVADVFYLEMGGVTFPSLRLGDNVSVANVKGITQGLQLVGIRSLGATYFGLGLYTLAFFGSVGTVQIRTDLIKTGTAYTDPTGGVVTTGGGCRCEGAFLSTSIFSSATYQNLCAVGNASFLGPGQTLVGGVFALGFVTGFFNPQALNLGSSTVGPVRVLGATNLGGIEADTSMQLQPVGTAISGAGAKPAMYCLQNAGFMTLNSSLTGTTGNNDVGLDLTGAQDTTIFLPSLPTVTGALGDVRLFGGTIISWAQANAGVIDGNGNRIFGAGNAPGHMTAVAPGAGVLAVANAPAGATTYARYIKWPDGTGGFYTVGSLT